jgi:hypothetical protein
VKQLQRGAVNAARRGLDDQRGREQIGEQSSQCQVDIAQLAGC